MPGRGRCKAKIRATLGPTYTPVNPSPSLHVCPHGIHRLLAPGVVTGQGALLYSRARVTAESLPGSRLSRDRELPYWLGCHGSQDRISLPIIRVSRDSFSRCTGMSGEIVFSWYLGCHGFGLLLVPGCHEMESSLGTRVVTGEHLLDPTTILMTKNRSVSYSLFLTG